MNNPMVSNMVISLGAMQVARKIPFDDPQTLLYVRIAYVATQVITLLVYYYTASKIRAKKDMTTLKFVEPAGPLTGEPDKVITTTVRDYDLDQVSKLVRSTYMAVLMMGFMHLYLKFTQPLFVQALMGLKSLYEAKPVQIHVFGKEPSGDLQRPFKAAAGMFGPTNDVKTDKASIEEAEKAAREAASKKDD
ncbi:inorganic phosphate transporter [Exidia glandulosa HHB12029]|uniref:Inorganic phosphate transporter n=1 Tax=Exidia glandulosa HHB12029 TaxID=1314781 RepID=A0A165PY18_EXIGL|nr:inorganic phosphate transporter [Exidia glandulosa HHB12029]